MALLETHLKEIQLCSLTISELPFPSPKIFANALLRTNDITALIRDTEAHERALFSVAPPSQLPSARESSSSSARRTTAFEPLRDFASNDAYRGPRRDTAVAAVLGGDIAERLRRERTGQTSRRGKDDVDVEFLLNGAQKLCNVYPIPGALEKIATLRNRYGKVTASLEYYEALVAEQTMQLKQMNRPASSVSMYDDEDDDPKDGNTVAIDAPEALPMTEDDLRREEEGVRELERKKQALEERVTGMEKDLGGILR